jgi:hypothetical protein
MSDTLRVEKIGWFYDVVPTHPQGFRVPGPLFNKLLDIGKKYLVNRCFGSHVCKLCFHDEREYLEMSADERKHYVDFSYWGNGEIWIKGKSKLWVAPTMIVHYIRDHGFFPPQEFMDDLGALTEDEASYYHKFEKKDNAKFKEIYGVATR